MATGQELLTRLRGWAPRPTEPTTLLVVSLGMLPTQKASGVLWEELGRILETCARRHDASVYTLAPAERALLLRITEMGRIGVISDLKLELLRLVQQHFPDFFGLIDQSRLIRAIDLRAKIQNAVKFVEQYLGQAKPVEAAKPVAALRALHQTDIAKVESVNKQVGPQNFARAFVQGQPVVSIAADELPSHFLTEYFVGMDVLKKHVFTDVELRGSGNLFNQLTITLDRLLIGAFQFINPHGVKCSINLNVETVFTRAFKDFVETTPEATFANIVFEFRQANVLQHFDEFDVASRLILSRNGTVAIDAVFPETVGILNLSRLSATIAKIFWRQGAETMLPERAKEVEAIQDAGTLLILSRVDDEAGITIGQRLGITMFQGFFVDRLMAKNRA